MRKSFLLLTLVAVIALLWYLFIKPHDYRVAFSVKTLPGTVNQTIKLWNNSLDSVKLIYQTSVNSLEQQWTTDEHFYVYRWEMKLINDSTTRVKVYITEPGNSLINKISIPFVETQIERVAKKNVEEFYKRMHEHLDNIEVEIEGVSNIEKTYCVYIPVNTTQLGKANGMMNNYPFLSSFIMENKIQTNGMPILEITEWDTTNDSIKYNFCFPIIKTDSLPTHSLVEYKWLENTKAIKAVYNGNYITSDRAWYSLIHYAEKHGIEVINKPIEIYYNNPNFGDNEKEWRADVYLPIKKPYASLQIQ